MTIQRLLFAALAAAVPVVSRPCADRGAEHHGARSAGRRLGPDGALDAAGADRGGARLQRAGDERARRRRHDRPRAVRQQQQRRSEEPDRRRLRDGRRDHRQPVAGDACRRDADRAADRRIRGDRRARLLRHPDDRRSGREAEGRSGRGELGRRLGRRRRSHRGRADRGGGRRRSDQDQLHPLFGRRRGAGGDPRRPGDGRHLRHGRVEGADRRGRASPSRGHPRPSGSRASTRRR